MNYSSKTSLNTKNSSINLRIDDSDNESEANFIIYFIRCEFNTNRIDLSLMKDAFHSIKSNKLSKKWISFEDLKKMESIDNDLFVIKSFYGQVFEYLLERNARIVGPLSLLYCYSTDCQIRYETIPLKSNPIFSQCMRDLVVCISHVEENEKFELIHKVESMSAGYSIELTPDVTHLVTDSVRTQKYIMASSLGITIVSKEWINECWAEYQYKLCDANHHEIINQFEIPVFEEIVCKHRNQLLKGVTISVSQTEIKECDRIKRIVESSGGLYSDTLQKNCLLLLKEPKGEKFENAKRMKIQCVHITWLYESVISGKLLPTDEKSMISKSRLENKANESPSKNDFRFDSMILSGSEVDQNSVTSDGLDWIVSCNSCVNHSCNKAQINSKSNKTETNKNEESFKLPFPVSESTRRVLEKLKNQNRNQRTELHKSLGERLNEKLLIEWSDECSGHSPIQRPY